MSSASVRDLHRQRSIVNDDTSAGLHTLAILRHNYSIRRSISHPVLHRVRKKWNH